MTMKRSLRFEKNPAFHLEMSPRQIVGGFSVLPPQVGNIGGGQKSQVLQSSKCIIARPDQT